MIITLYHYHYHTNNLLLTLCYYHIINISSPAEYKYSNIDNILLIKLYRYRIIDNIISIYNPIQSAAPNPLHIITSSPIKHKINIKTYHTNHKTNNKITICLPSACSLNPNIKLYKNTQQIYTTCTNYLSSTALYYTN